MFDSDNLSASLKRTKRKLSIDGRVQENSDRITCTNVFAANHDFVLIMPERCFRLVLLGPGHVKAPAFGCLQISFSRRIRWSKLILRLASVRRCLPLIWLFLPVIVVRFMRCTFQRVRDYWQKIHVTSATLVYNVTRTRDRLVHTNQRTPNVRCFF